MELFKPEFGLVFWMFIAFACLYFILAKYAWPYVVKMMEERAELIDKGVVYAQEAKSHLDNAKAEADKLVAEAQKQQADILRDAAKIKTQIIEDAKAEAQEEAKKVTAAAQVSIDQARKESEKQLRQEVSTYALEIAEKVIRENLQGDKAQKDLVDKLLNEAENNN